ncbi:hypothetical protein PFICI_05809 [Pestalotiopsis fici W106-1]|uniref:2-dehydropantoate 2-reductase n=1 Tax=Pestalotiopsis fici (strain W106-1 / CGMCC3.15140) TaxID=1229662 RepID=W3XCV4_PESFW|nr:uncharacterized protein PFICI_05809 [Pestalotiopsis fici W106-1]ETS83933.1 hypothetical protein PFICI_05809 [Pestalotiopsis fici W106-1]
MICRAPSKCGQGVAKTFSSSAKPVRTEPGHPAWLQQILRDTAPPPKLYAWTSANLKDAADEQQNSDLAISPKKRIHVLGLGNLGRLFASNLRKLSSPPPVTLILHRKALLEQWVSSPGIEITRAGQVEKFTDFNVEWWTEERPSTGPVVEATAGTGISNLIVATKASDALPQVDRLRKYLDDTSTIAFTQNGMCKLWPPLGSTYNSHRFSDQKQPNWLACVTTHGVVSSAPFKSIHASVASAAIGPVSLNTRSADESGYLIEAFVNGPDLYAREAARSELWILQLEKLVVNAVINPLTAVLRCKNGELFVPRDDALPLIIDKLIEEASQVLRELIIHPSSTDILKDVAAHSKRSKDRSTDVSLQDAKEQLLARFAFEKLHHMVHEVGYKVRENTSSMLQDVRAGKRTEVQDFNGWLVDTAQFLSPDSQLPTHMRLISLVEDGLTVSRSELSENFNLSRKA